MAKSTKNKDKLGTFDEFRAPWESEAGGDTEIDKPKLKRFIFNLLSDKATAQDAREDALEAAKTAETERDEAKDAAANASPEEAQKRIAKLEKDLEAVTAERDKFVADKEQAELRAEVLGDFASHKAAKYVTGSTKEELEKSLAEVKADWGVTDGDADEDEDPNPLASQPRTDLTNPITGPAGGADAPVDFEKAAAQILGYHTL